MPGGCNTNTNIGQETAIIAETMGKFHLRLFETPVFSDYIWRGGNNNDEHSNPLVPSNKES